MSREHTTRSSDIESNSRRRVCGMVDMRQRWVDCRRQRHRLDGHSWLRDRASKRVEGWDDGSLRERAASKTERDQRGSYTLLLRLTRSIKADHRQHLYRSGAICELVRFQTMLWDCYVSESVGDNIAMSRLTAVLYTKYTSVQPETSS
jgi:hypothetical protein